MSSELERIVSVDDHVVEPAHLSNTWLPEPLGSSSRMPATSARAPVAVAATSSFGNAIRMLDLDLDSELDPA